MKRGVLLLIIFILSINSVFAEEDKLCDIPPILIKEGIDDEDKLFNYIVSNYEGSLTSQYLWGSWHSDNFTDKVIPYLDCFEDNKEKYTLLNDMLFTSMMIGLPQIYDHTPVYSTQEHIISEGERLSEALNTYAKGDINYRYYLGRNSFFLGIGYYNDGDKEKALEYFNIAKKYRYIPFEYSPNLYLNDNDILVLKSDNYSISNEKITKELIKLQYTDYGCGWREYDNTIYPIEQGNLVLIAYKCKGSN